jgi:hypothetical protein
MSVSQIYLPPYINPPQLPTCTESERQDTSNPDYFAINSTSLSKWATIGMLSWTHLRTAITTDRLVSPCGWASYTWYGLCSMSIWELEGCVRQICYHSNSNSISWGTGILHLTIYSLHLLLGSFVLWELAGIQCTTTKYLLLQCKLWVSREVRAAAVDWAVRLVCSGSGNGRRSAFPDNTKSWTVPNQP